PLCIYDHRQLYTGLRHRSHSNHSLSFFFLMLRPPPRSTLFTYTTLFRSGRRPCSRSPASAGPISCCTSTRRSLDGRLRPERASRSEEHTSELQSRGHLVCRLLLEKKKTQKEYNRERFSRHA